MKTSKVMPSAIATVALLVAGCGDPQDDEHDDALGYRIAEEATHDAQEGRVEPVSQEEFERAAEVVDQGLTEDASPAEEARFRDAAEAYAWGVLNSEVRVTTGEGDS